MINFKAPRRVWALIVLYRKLPPATLNNWNIFRACSDQDSNRKRGRREHRNNNRNNPNQLVNPSRRGDISVIHGDCDGNRNYPRYAIFAVFIIAFILFIQKICWRRWTTWLHSWRSWRRTLRTSTVMWSDCSRWSRIALVAEQTFCILYHV